MSVDALLEQLNTQAKNIAPLGATFKFVVDDKSIFIDGTGEANEVSVGDNDADCTVTTSLETLQELKSGSLNPMMAVMGGKIKIKGDMALAMKLQSLLS